MFSYLTTHSLGDILHRFLRGLVRVRGLSGSGPFSLIFVLIPNGSLPTFRFPCEKQPMVTVASSLVLTFYFAFSWSAVVQRGIRFLLPIFPIIFLMLADFLVFYAVRLTGRWWLAPRAAYLSRLAMGGLLVALSVVWLVQVSWRDFQSPSGHRL